MNRSFFNRIVLYMSVCVSHCYADVHLLVPQEMSSERIKEYQASIAHSHARNGWFRLGCKVAGICGGLGACYMLYQYDKEMPIEQTKALNEATKALNEASALLGRYAAYFKEQVPDGAIDTIEPLAIPMIEKTFKQKLFEWAVNPASVFALGICVVRAIFAEQGMLHHVRDETALVQVYEELEQMQSAIAVLRASGASSVVCLDDYLGVIMTVFNALVNEMEQVLGYMHFKAAHLKLACSNTNGDAHIALFVQQMIDRTGQLLADEQQQYMIADTDAQKVTCIKNMAHLLDQCRKEVERSIYAFARCEKHLEQ